MALMNNQKKTCYVGGLADEVDESVIRAAFIAFGDISEVVTLSMLYRGPQGI